MSKNCYSISFPPNVIQQDTKISLKTEFQNSFQKTLEAEFKKGEEYGIAVFLKHTVFY